MYDIIIIGAGCAGLTAAIYATRAGKKVLVIEGESIGGQISYSPRVENYPGYISISGAEFSDKLYGQATALGVQLEFDRVTRINNGAVKEIFTEYGGIYQCKALIIAAGVKHRHLGIEREDELAGKGVSYCAICDGAFYKNQTVAVVGGGSSALQSARLLANGCKKVYLIHRRNEFRGEQMLAQAVLAIPNVEAVLSSNVTKLIGDDALTAIEITGANATSTVQINGLFIMVGQQPDNGILSGIVALDDKGYIIAGEDCKTSAAGIFAAGDCRTKAVRQLTTAAADGAVSALAACDYIG